MRIAYAWLAYDNPHDVFRKMLFNDLIKVIVVMRLHYTENSPYYCGEFDLLLSMRTHAAIQINSSRRALAVCIVAFRELENNALTYGSFMVINIISKKQQQKRERTQVAQNTRMWTSLFDNNADTTKHNSKG